MSYFDNFFITLVLCLAGGFASDNLNKYMRGLPTTEDNHQSSNSRNKDDDQDDDKDDFAPSKPLPPEPPAEDKKDDEGEEEEDSSNNDPFFSLNCDKPSSSGGGLMDSPAPVLLDTTEEVLEKVVEPVMAQPDITEPKEPVLMDTTEDFEPTSMPKHPAFTMDTTEDHEDHLVGMQEPMLAAAPPSAAATDLLADFGSPPAEFVSKTTLDEHEDELAELLKEAQKDGESDDDELAQVHAKVKDEGDPWRLEEEDKEAESDSPDPIATNAGESLVHLDSSEEVPGQDDVSHKAVFGDDEVDEDDVDEDDILDEEAGRQEGKRDSTSSGTSSGTSSSEGPDVEEPVLLDMKKNKSDTKKYPKDDGEDDDEVEEAQEALPHKNGTQVADLLGDLALPKPEDAASRIEDKFSELKESAFLINPTKLEEEGT